MGKIGFFEKLKGGSGEAEAESPPKPEVTEITVPEKVEDLISEPKPEPSIAGNSKDLKDKLDGTRHLVAELRGEVKASPAVIQGGQILETLDGVLARLEELEIAFKESACPECGVLGYGGNVKELPESEFQGINGTRGLFPFHFDALFAESQRMVRFKQCVNLDCGHIEVMKEKEERR